MLLGHESQVQQRRPPSPVLLVDGHLHGPGLTQSHPQVGVVAQRFGGADPFGRGFLGVERAEGLDQ